MTLEHPVQDISPLTARELSNLWVHLQKPAAISEIAILLGCLGLSWLIVRLWRGRQGDVRSIWLGHRVIDGALFPVLSLGLALLAYRLLQNQWPMLLFRVALPVLMSLAVIRVTVKVLRVVFPESRAMRVIERTVSWLAWLATVSWVTGLLPILLTEMEGVTWKVGGSVLNLRSLIEGAINAVLVLILSLSLSSALESQLLKGATDNISLRKMAVNALRSILLLVGFMLAMSTAGIDLTALSVFGGAIGVGLGFGLQKLAANYVSGFVILAERSLRIGDLVKVDNFEGTITDINTRYTVLRAVGGREAIVPNETLITQRVENASLSDRRVSVTTVVQVAYGTDVRALFPELLAAVSEVPRVMTDPAPAILLSSFAADGLELTISFWVLDPELGLGAPRSNVNLAVLDTLNRLGIDIPFPQRVLHIPPPASALPLEVSSPAP
ncbi:mechanosensitive ion channel family protein [Aquabacterium sp.]|jgi:small-conductance mechanosensitive channel|uniref:mechanosensitive ion channel family protein n=1 Tax=Aquabacterium sp. TaxID=1872578 RepID=UPI0027BA7586|nr:mechanosensitive ion channel domain-containing protein [Aquabacterium sp.]